MCVDGGVGDLDLKSDVLETVFWCVELLPSYL